MPDKMAAWIAGGLGWCIFGDLNDCKKGGEVIWQANSDALIALGLQRMAMCPWQRTSMFVIW